MRGSPLSHLGGWSLRQLVPLLPGVLLALAFVAVLAATAALEQSGDSLAYLTKARDGSGLFHPHHLLFNAAVRSVYLGLDMVIGVRDVVIAAQVHNLAFTFVALLTVYWIGLRWLGSQLLGLTGMALYGSTTALMVYASQAEVYVPAVALLGVAAAFFLKLVESPASRSSRLGLVVAWVLAVLYHQTAVLFVIPMVLALLVVRSRDLARALAVASAQAGAIAIGAYWLADQATPSGANKAASFLRFIFSYALAQGVRWGSASNFTLSGVTRLLKSHAWGLSTLSPDQPAVLIGMAMAGGAVAIAAWCVSGPRGRLLLCFAVSWAVCFLAFFLWWLPEGTEFAVLTSMPVCLAVMAGVAPILLSSHIGVTGGRVVAAGILAIAALNCWGGIRLEVLPRHRTRGEAYRQARFLATFDDGSTLRLTKFKVSTTIRFYFGGSTDSVCGIDELDRALQAGGSRQPWMVRSAWRRVIADLSKIQPSGQINGRDGFQEPGTRLRTLEWIFNLRRDEGGWYSDDWEVASDEGGNSYIVVMSGCRALSEPRQLLLQLVDELEPAAPERRAFARWLKANPGPLTESLVRQ